MIIDYKQLTGLKRIPLHLWDVPGFKEPIGHKPYMTKDEVYELLTDSPFFLSEKVDGKTGYDSIIKSQNQCYVFYENTLTRHSIPYKRKYKKLVFDIAVLVEGKIKFDNVFDHDIMDVYFSEYPNYIQPQGMRMSKDEVDSYFMEKIIEWLNAKSQFGAPKIEGLVIKNYHKQLFGKIVNPEFEEGIKENYIRASR
jgi:hypothetical protein